MSDPSFEMRLQRLYAEHPHYPDAPLFAVEVENRLSRAWALRRVLIGSAGIVGGFVATFQIAGARLFTRLGDAARLVSDASHSLHAAALHLPSPLSDIGQLPFGGEVLWLVAGLAVLAGAFLASRSIQEI